MPNSKANAVFGAIEAAFANADNIPVNQAKLVSDTRITDALAPGSYLWSDLRFSYDYTRSGSIPATYATGSTAEITTLSIFLGRNTSLDIIDVAEELREYVQAQCAARAYLALGIGYLLMVRFDVFENPDTGAFVLAIDWEVGDFAE